MDFKKRIEELEEQIKALKRSYYRDMKDQWSSSQHPVTGVLTPVDAEQLVLNALVSRDAGN